MAAKRRTVIVDTREQRSWSFPADSFDVVRGTLREGDYTLAGLEGRLAIERKSLGDFVGTVIGDWLRFRKELIRLSGYESACIVVECNAADIAEKKYESEANPASVFGRAHAIYLDHGIPIFFWGPRTQCEPLVWQYLTLAANKMGA